MSTKGNEDKTDFKKNLEMIMKNKNNLKDPMTSIHRETNIPQKHIPLQTSFENEIRNESDLQIGFFKEDKLTEVSNGIIPKTSCTSVPIIPHVPDFHITSIPIPINKSAQNVPLIKEISTNEHLTVPILISNNKIPQVPGIPMIPFIKAPVIISNVPQIPGVPVPQISNNFPQIPGVPKIPNIGVIPVPQIGNNISQVPGVPKIPNIGAVPQIGNSIPQVPGVPKISNLGAVPMPPVNNLNHIPGVPNIPGVPGINKNLNILSPQIPKIPIPGVHNLPPTLQKNVPNMPGLSIPFPSIVISPQIGLLLKRILFYFYSDSQINYKISSGNEAFILDSNRSKEIIRFIMFDDSQFSINTIKFEEEFCQRKRDAITELKDGNNKQVIIGKPSVLLPSRQQNINIVLSKLKLTPITIVEALIIYDLKILTPQTCDLLLSILPSPAEINQVDCFDGDPMILADADQFVLLMKTAPGYDLRLKSILFQKCYKEEKEELRKKIEIFFMAFEFISSNKKFHRWLEIVLAYGNYLNGSTNRGGAFAFRLDILSKLAELKSTDNKKNLLFYIVEYIGDVLKEDELLNLSKDFEIFSSLFFSAINELYKEFNSKFKNLTNLFNILQKDDENLEEDDRSAEFISSFYSEAGNFLKLIEENMKKIEEDYSGLIKKFGDSSKDMPMETLFEILNKFGKDITV